MFVKEQQIEQHLIGKLVELKYSDRPDIRDKAALEANFRAKFQALNKVQLTDAEFARLRDSIISADVFQAAKTLREIGYLRREDGTALHFTLVNLKDWCKNDFEVIHQLRINTDSSYHRYDVILLINGLPLVQIELKALTISPRTAMKQIVDYKADSGNGYTNSLMCFMQLFIVSQQPHRDLILRQQPGPALRLQCRGALPAHLPVGGSRQPQDHPPRRLRCRLPGQMHPRADDQPLHGPRRQRAKAYDHAALPDLRRAGHC